MVEKIYCWVAMKASRSRLMDISCGRRSPGHRSTLASYYFSKYRSAASAVLRDPLKARSTLNATVQRHRHVTSSFQAKLMNAIKYLETFKRQEGLAVMVKRRTGIVMDTLSYNSIVYGGDHLLHEGACSGRYSVSRTSYLP